MPDYQVNPKSHWDGIKKQRLRVLDCGCGESSTAFTRKYWHPRLNQPEEVACFLLARPVFENWRAQRSEEHTSELQSQSNLVCRLLLEKKKHTTEYEPSSTQQDSTSISR